MLNVVRVGHVEAQAVEILCDTTFDTQSATTPNPFPGAYYYITTDIDVFDEFRFMRVTAEGATEIQAPFSSELALSIGNPRLSPDGQTTIFLTSNSQSPLVAWNLETNEVATLTLPESEADYLSSSFNSYYRFWRWVEWQNNNQLVINYFDENFNRVIARTIITVHQNPLQLSRDTYETVIFSDLPIPTNNRPLAVLLSPLEEYASVLSWAPVPDSAELPHLQIFDLDTEMLVFDFPPSISSYLTSDSMLWVNNDQITFINIANSVTFDASLVEINANGSNFQINSYLWDTLELTFGESVDFYPIFETTLNESGNQIAFEITETSQAMNYLVLYDFTSHAITAICDQHDIIRTDEILPFWAQDDTYFGYWDSGRVVVFDVETGDVYRFPNPERREFVGWAES